MLPFWIILGVIVVVVLYIWGTYNNLVVLRNRCEEAWSGIEVQLKRRSDLIPNLVETVKGYAKHEKEVFENVTKARAQMSQAGTVAETAAADNMITGALKSLFAVAENYPELKANENFLELQRELGDTEDKIAYSRQFYNTNAQALDNALEQFPSNIIGSTFNFKPQPYFAATEAEREPVKVSFSGK